MNTECFIKSFMLIAVILLMISCWTDTEKFANIDFTSQSLVDKIKKNNPFELELNNTHVLVSFDQLKEEEKKIIIDKLKDNSKFMDYRENKQNVEKGIFYKTPVFVVPKNEVVLNNKLDFVLTSDSGAYALTPSISNKDLKNTYLHFDEDLELLYYSVVGGNSKIVYINDNGFVNLFGLQEKWNGTNFRTLGKVDNIDQKLKINIK